MALWNPRLHPRGPDGRFISKASIGLRVSTRSVSLSVGRRVPVIPGKANLYVGALVRLERANRRDGAIDRALDAIQTKALNKIPNDALRGVALKLAQGDSARTPGATISASGFRPNTPTIRVNSNTGRTTQTTGKTARPGRKPRAPRQPRARRVAR